MPRVDEKAVLEVEDIPRAMAAARAQGPLAFALIAWMYEQGARASEPGLQLVRDIDLRAGRIRVVHLKREGTVNKPATLAHDLVPMLRLCKEALPPWLEAREPGVPQQRDLLFPSADPRACYTCRGTGKWKHTKRGKDKEGKNESTNVVDPCRQCGASGTRYGISRYEVDVIVRAVLSDAGVPPNRRHPHVLRHSIVTHLLEKNVPAKAIQERVGHAVLATTLDYVRVTKSAAAALEKALGNIYDGEEDPP